MRNLKRALSLTLASVMLLGMMVVGTSAASFPDVTAEDNVEAIEVLAAVKVLQGYDDGQYHADTPVTRNQMATIICRMMGWRDGDFAGLNPFPDVPDWAANYVAACVANGIINGRDDGRFHGDDTVTATEAASMMLRALGYTRMPVGGDWARAVAQQASKINLFDELDVGAYTALTRGDVSQLALNTLESAMVEVDDNTLHIDAGNGVTVSGGQVNYVVVTSQKDYALAISRDESNGNALNGINGPIVELGEHVFNGNLKKDDVVDSLGRPSISWSYNNREIIEVDKSANLVYTKETKAADIERDLRGYSIDGTSGKDFEAQINGVDATDSDGTDYTIGNGGATTNSAAADVIAKLTKDGYTVTVYANNQRVITNVACVQEELAKVTVVNKTKNEITLRVANGQSIVINDKHDAYENLAGKVAQNDYVLAVTNGNGSSTKVIDAYVGKTVDGTVSTYSNKGALTIEGTQYKKSACSAVSDPQYLTRDDYKDTKNPATLYMDSNGYYIAVKNDVKLDADEVCFVVYTDNSSSWSVKKEVYVILPDGTSGVYTVSSFNNKSGQSDINTGIPNGTTGLYAYTLTDDGIALKDFTANGVSKTSEYRHTKMDAANTTIDKDKSRTVVGDANSTEVYLTSGTRFYMVDRSKIGNVAITKTNASTSDLVNSSVGLSTISTTTFANGTDALEVAYREVNGQKVAIAVYGNYNGSVSSASKDLVYVTGKSWESNNDQEFLMDAVFSGNDNYDQIWVKGEKAPGLYTYTKNNKEVYTLTAATTTNGAHFGALTAVTNLNGAPTQLIVAGAADEFKNLDKAVIMDVTGDHPALSDVGALVGVNYSGYVAVDSSKNVLAVYIASMEKAARVIAATTAAAGTNYANLVPGDVVIGNKTALDAIQSEDNAPGDTIVIKIKTGATDTSYKFTIKDASGRTVYKENVSGVTVDTAYRVRVSLDGKNQYRAEGDSEWCVWRFQDGADTGVGETAANGVYTYTLEGAADGVVQAGSFTVKRP